MGKDKRPQTEGTEKALIKKLKEAVRSQRKEIANLRKQLNRRDDLAEDYQELLEENEAAKRNTENRGVTTERCPECKMPAITFEVGKFVVYKCTECKWRARK